MCTLITACAAIATPALAREPLAILKTECFRCHTEEKRKGGLVMTSREGLLKGGDTIAALVPGDPDGSFLYELLLEDGDPHMPPKEQLPDAEIAAIRNWIQSGAPWDQAILDATATPADDVRLTSLPQRYAPVAGLEVSPDGARLAVGIGAAVQIWEWFDLENEDPKKGPVRELRQTATLEGHQDAIQSLAWSPDGKALASGGFRRVLVWDAESWDRIAVLEESLQGRVTALTFTPDGANLISADGVTGFSGRLQVWSLKDWSVVKALDEAHRDTIFDLNVSPDGTLLASGSADKLVKLWKTEDWSEQRFFEGHTGYVLTVCFSPQSDRLATAGDDEEIKVWNLETGKQIHGFTDRLATGAVTDLFWSTDPAKKGQEPEKKEGEEPKPFDWLVAVTEDGKPRAYTDLVEHDGTQRSGGARARAWALPEGFAGALTQVAFAGAQETVIAGSEDGFVATWNLSGAPQEWVVGKPETEAGP